MLQENILFLQEIKLPILKNVYHNNIEPIMWHQAEREIIFKV